MTIKHDHTLTVKIEGMGELLKLISYHFSNFDKKLDKIMGKQDQLNASLSELNDATNAIAARIQKFIDAEKDNVSQESLAELQTVADNLKAMGTDPSAPIPPIETAPTEESKTV